MGARTPNPQALPGSREPKLTEEAKVFLVGMHATFRTNPEIIAAIREEFGVTITEEAVYWYKPSRPGCPKRWRDLAAKLREEWNARVGEAAIANLAWRQEQRQKLAEKQLNADRVNAPLALKILEDGAKDQGGLFTNRRDLTSGGERIESPTVPLGSLSLELRRRIVEEMEAAKAKDQPGK